MINHIHMEKVIIYTDGACRGNPGQGGWGALLQHEKGQKKIYGGEENTTNNRMELLAAIMALDSLKRSCQVELYTDSVYVKDGITKWLKNWQQNNWKTSNKKEVKNKDLWMKLIESSSPHEINWRWVKGHAGITGNEVADQLANKGIDSL